MKPKKNLYHKYTVNKVIPVSVIVSDADLKKMETIAKNNSFLTVEDYIKSSIDTKYESIDANGIINVKNPSAKYDNNVHELKIHQLENPKLSRFKNNVNDTKQITLDKFYK